jgi:hypothetical protein
MSLEDLPEKVDNKTIYILCPDINCEGWYEKKLRCENNKKKYFELEPCPHYNEARKMIFCYFGHLNTLPVDYSSWKRVDCSHKDCNSVNFTLMFGNYQRIPLDKLNDFLKLPFERGK